MSQGGNFCDDRMCNQACSSGVFGDAGISIGTIRMSMEKRLSVGRAQSGNSRLGRSRMRDSAFINVKYLAK